MAFQLGMTDLLLIGGAGLLILFGKDILAWFSGIFGDVGGAVGGAVDAVKGAAETAKSAAESVGGAVTSAGSSVLEGAKSAVSGVTGGSVAGLNLHTDSILGGVGDRVSNTIAGVNALTSGDLAGAGDSYWTGTYGSLGLGAIGTQMAGGMGVNLPLSETFLSTSLVSDALGNLGGVKDMVGSMGGTVSSLKFW